MLTSLASPVRGSALVVVRQEGTAISVTVNGQMLMAGGARVDYAEVL
jgi:hypothetical protein